jgi:heme a synthase
MTRRYTQLAWAAAVCTYLLIILGAIVRITGSGLGCGDHWPLCNGRLLPPLDLPTLIEYGHRLAAALVVVLVGTLVAYASWFNRWVARGERGGRLPTTSAYLALCLLLLQVALGAITVKTGLTPTMVVLHLATAMLLLAALLAATQVGRLGWPTPAAAVPVVLGFVTVLLGALTANLGAAMACLGFPLCNGQLSASNALESVHWAHRLLAYTLATYVTLWALGTHRRSLLLLLGLVAVQVMIGAAMVLLALPGPLQAAHVAVGAALWAGLVLVALDRRSQPS